MEENNSNQAAEYRQPEPQQTQRRSTIRFQEAWETISTLVGRPSVRTAAKLTAALIVLALSALGYRHYVLITRGE